MARKKNNSREMEERMERIPNRTDSHGDQNSGDEGVDDPAMSATHRDDMTETPMQGDKLEEEQNQRMESQRSQRTEERSNDERWDDASDFSGRGDQKEGAEDAEGTGYTK